MGRPKLPEDEKAWKCTVEVSRPEVMKLKLSGYSIPEIAVKLRLTEVRVRSDLNFIMDRVGKESPNTAYLRQEQLLRLETMWKGLYSGVISGDADKIKAGLRLMERQAKLMGLDIDQRALVTLTPSGDWDSILRAATMTNEAHPKQALGLGTPETDAR
jgi:hypothetical protein